MTINALFEDNAVILIIKGTITSQNINILEDKIRELMANNNNNIILDCSSVQTIDSISLELLLQELKNCRAFGGDLVIVNSNDDIREILRITRVDKEIKTYALQKEALQEFKNKLL